MNNSIDNNKDDKNDTNIKSRIYDDGTYYGDFKNNKREGKGIMYYNNGDKYEGDWKNDYMKGKGIMHYNNGNKYEGEWENNRMEGKGKITVI